MLGWAFFCLLVCLFVFKIRILLRKKYIVHITMPSFNECGFSCVEVPNIAVLVNWKTL